jgi:hypothetical protein
LFNLSPEKGFTLESPWFCKEIDLLKWYQMVGVLHLLKEKPEANGNQVTQVSNLSVFHPEKYEKLRFNGMNKQKSSYPTLICGFGPKNWGFNQETFWMGVRGIMIQH